MKAEHRHELKTNALAETLNRALHGLKAGPSRHSLLIGVVAVVVAVVVVTGFFIWKGQKEGRSALWEKYGVAQGTLDNAGTDDLPGALTKFKELSDQNPHTLPGAAANFDRARVLLRRGLERQYSTERDAALSDIKEARKLYADLAADSFIRDSHPLLAEEAMLGVAKADESLGDLDKALEGYRNVAKTFPKGAHHEAADQRAKYLENPDNRNAVKSLYEKLEGQARPAESSDKK
jgi:tetratricopeptide (TPR) repeat protein